MPQSDAYNAGDDPAPDSRGMSYEEIAKIVSSEITAAQRRDSVAYSESTERALDYFNGVMHRDTPAPPGRSKAQSNDVADTVGWIMPGLMRVFFSGDTMGEFQMQLPEDEEAARQATDYINYVFLRECDGYTVGWNAMHDALTVRIGIMKAWWDDTPEYRIELMSGISEEQFVSLTNEPDVEVLEHTAIPPMEVEGYEPIPPTHNLKIKKLLRPGKIKVAAVPPNEFLIDARATDVHDARFLGTKTRETRSDLIKMGHDRDKVMAAPVNNALTGNDNFLPSQNDITNWTETAFRNDKAMEEVDYYELYVLLDKDGDGIAEWVQVLMAGGTGVNNILSCETWGDPVPFAKLTPYDIPHQFYGRSIADDVMDVQQRKTVITRNMLDNFYLQQMQQKAVQEGAILNPDELENPQIGGTIRVKQGVPVNLAYMPIVTPFIGEAALAVLEHEDKVIEKRTGITQASAALDPDQLQNQTAAAAHLIADASHSRQELIARNFAEGGYADIYRIMLKLSVKHQDRARTIRLRGKWIDVDPRAWNAEMDVTINVGLGTGSKERDMMMLEQIYAKQKEAIQALGEDNPMVTPSRVWHTVDQMVNAAGLKNTEQYFAKISDEDWAKYQQSKQGKPDPKMEEAKAKIEVEKQKLAANQQADQAKAQQDMQIAQMKLQNERELGMAKLKMEYELRMQEMQMEAALKSQQMQYSITRGDPTNVPRTQ